jgi:hypothetical protein
MLADQPRRLDVAEIAGHLLSVAALATFRYILDRRRRWVKNQ